LKTIPIKKSYLEQKWYYRVAKVFFLLLPFLVVAIIFFKGHINIDISQKNISDILQKNSVYIVYVVIGLVLYFLILKGFWRGFLYIVFGGLEDDTKKKISGVAQSVGPDVQPAPAKPNKMVLLPIIIIIGVFAIFVLSEMEYIKLPRINLNSGQSSHIYGAPCTTSDGKTGLYGTKGGCYTCSTGTAVTNPINNNCSNGIAGVYCCGTASNGGNKNSKNSKCIPTGCGSLWRCSGSYYISGVQIRVTAACFPSGLRPGDIYSGWSGTCRQCP